MLTTTYSAYIALVILITVLVARTLSKNGEIFLIDGFNGNVALARSVNHMLVVGFYLVNLGFALLQLEAERGIESIDHSLVFLSTKIGFVLLVLGIVHFFNLLVIHMFKRGQRNRVEKVRANDEPIHAAGAIGHE